MSKELKWFLGTIVALLAVLVVLRLDARRDPSRLMQSPTGLDFSLVGKTPKDFRQACSRSGGEFGDLPIAGGAVCHMDSTGFLQIGATYVDGKVHILNRRYAGQEMYPTLLNAAEGLHAKRGGSASDMHKSGCTGLTWTTKARLIVLETCPDATHLSVGLRD